MKNYVLNSSDFVLVTERNRTNRGGNAAALIQLGRILMSDNKVVEGREFVKVVNSALAFFEAKYPFEYRYISGSPVIYLLDNRITDTMAVDDRGVIYINVGFLYNKAPYGLEMQPGSICNILYHECMHTFLSHVRRSIAFNEKNSDQKMSWQDMNIAADLEVNGTMVVDKICTKNFWEMYKGCYYDDVVGLPMESIAKYYKHIINHFKNQPPMSPIGSRMGKQGNQDMQGGQGNQGEPQTQQGDKQGDNKQNGDKDYSNMTAQEAAKDAERSADSAQLSANDAKRNFGNDSKQAKDAQSAADKAKDAADKAKDAASKGDTKEAQNQAREAANQANKAEQAANGQQNSSQQNQQNGQQGGQQGDKQQSGKQGDQGGMKQDGQQGGQQGEKQGGDGSQGGQQDGGQQGQQSGQQGGDGKSGQGGQGQSGDGKQGSQSGSQEGNDVQGQGGKNYSNMTAQEAAKDAMSSAKQAQDAADMTKRWSGENSQQAKDAQQAANNAKDAAAKAAEAAGRGDAKEAQRQAKEAARQAKHASDAAKNAISESGNNQNGKGKSKENNGEEGVIGGGMGDNGKSMYDAELHSGNGGKHTIIGEILRQSEINNNLRKSLEESGFDKDVVSDVCEEVESLTPKSNEELSELRNNIIKSKPKSGLAKICTDIKISDTVVENVWDEIVRKFLEHNTLFAGKKKKIADRKRVKWGDRRTLGIDMIRPYHPKGDASPQNINVLVDTSISIDMKTTLLFAQTLAKCCDKLEYSGVTLIPFATKVDENSAVYFTGDDAKNDKEALINRIIEMATNNEAGGGTRIKPCVDLIVKYSQSEPKSVWIILTDGEFSGEKSLTRILSASNRILFVVYNKQFEKKFKGHLKWCVNPDYDKLSKCYIDLEKEQK